MTSLTLWSSPSTFNSLGWALLHFLWQGTALAALAAVAMTLCRRASTRYAFAVIALCLMFVAPLGTFFLLLHFPDDAALKPYPVVATEWARDQVVNEIAPSPNSTIHRLSPSFDASPWLVELWLFGVAIFSLRSAGGFWLLERQRRSASNLVNRRVLAICQALERRIGLERTIRYCESQWLQTPAVIGWFRPIVFLPVTAITGLSEDQLESIVAHELAHIKRLDFLVNAFQMVVETLLFYHPAVWWLNRRIRAEREHCCDDAAIAICGNPVEYARALTLMEEWRSAPALAMAANRGPLSKRILHILGLKPMGSSARGLGLAGGILCLTAALAAGNALLGVAYPRKHAGAAPIVGSSRDFLRLADSPAQATPTPTPSPKEKPSPARPRAGSQPVAGGSYIESMKSAGLGELTVDQLIALKIQGVTPEYVRGLHEQGLLPDPSSVIAMRIQGVTPEYIRDLHALGLSPNADQLVAMKIQGVDAAYVGAIKNAGIQTDIDHLVSMRIQGVTPDAIREFHQQGLQPDADQIVSMRIQGVTPEYVRDIHALGLKPDVDQFVSMRIQGVTPEYVRGLQAAGFKFTVDEVISAKIQQITQEFIQRAVQHGFQNLTLDKLIQLKHLGVLETPADL
jgi:beta-lactamase regulating signal transducer with metallopeptidase domain